MNTLKIIHAPVREVSSHGPGPSLRLDAHVYVNGKRADTLTRERQGRAQTSFSWRQKDHADAIAKWESILKCKAQHLEYTPPTIEDALKWGVHHVRCGPCEGDREELAQELWDRFQNETSIDALGRDD